MPAAGDPKQLVEPRLPGPVAAIEESVDREALEHLGQTALMISGLMRGDDQRDPPHPRVAQQAGDPRLRRAAVEEDRGPRAILDQRRVALADVEEGDRECVRRIGRRRGVAPCARQEHDGEHNQRRAPAHRRSPPRRRGLEPSRLGAPVKRVEEGANGPDRRISGANGQRRGQRQSHTRPGQTREVPREPVEPPHEHAVGPPERRDEDGDRPGGARQSRGSHAQRNLGHARPHDRSDERDRDEVRCDAHDRDRPEVVREQRRRGNRRGDGDRGTLRERPGKAAQRSAQRRREQEDPRHRGEGELPRGILGDARVDREGDHGGDQKRVPAGADPARSQGDQAGDAHDSRPLQRRPRARERHVGRDQRDQGNDAAPRPEPEPGEQRRGEGAQQHHVLPGDREHVGEARAAKVVAQQRVDPLVLAEDHAAGHGRTLL